MDKKVLVFVVLSGILMGNCATTQSNADLSLDSAIMESAIELASNFNIGMVIAVLSIESESDTLSAYVIEELSSYLAKNKNIIVVDRKSLDIIQHEMNFQMSGEVSDESAQSIGKKLGAQVIVTGSITELPRNYRLRLKALNVETAVIESTSSFSNIKIGDPVIAQLSTGVKAADATPIANRYVSEDGFFAIIKPDQWDLVDTALKYKTMKAPAERGDASVTINFSKDKFGGSLDDYAEAIIGLREAFSEYCDYLEGEPFLTKNGLRGLKLLLVMEGIQNMGEIIAWQYNYIFSGSGTTKYLIACTIFLDEELGENEEDQYFGAKTVGQFDEIARSFEILKSTTSP
jgi:TolB-like protein